MRIRPATAEDLAEVLAIYDHEVAVGHATFDLEPGDRDVWRAKVREDLFLVAFEDDVLVGFAYAGAFRPRPAYEQTVESSVYLRSDAQGRGLGLLLYAALLGRVREAGRHTVLAVVALPNDASLRLHERLGFEQVGVMREVGRKFGRWIDVALLQLPLR